MFKKYDRETFDVLREQHNIMALVGNGFDVAMLNKYNTVWCIVDMELDYERTFL